ncbi:hypothetical protein O181_063239 [Austropuccinia psidii MF-1]|uniref:Uncharacterized protein n=1 Tax=Austropuccinia psidii MF-1 TaxID=1389203 RepID=A0A9Q3I2D1_9BASI|nr:hypothetical protein [Austropuccinia psidii MF-1]
MRQPTPGQSGSQFSEDLLQEPCQANEPPVHALTPPAAGLSKVPESQLLSHETNCTYEPGAELASME